MAHDDLEDSDIFALEQLVLGQPTNADAWVALAEYRWEQRRYADALAALNRATRASHDPEQILGCYLTKGDLLLDAFPEQAAAHYRRAAELSPRWPGPSIRLGLLALREGDLDVARAEAASASRQVHEPGGRAVGAVLAELVASHHEFDRETFTRRLVRRLDTAGIPRTEDLTRYLVVLHNNPRADLEAAARGVWQLLLRMVPLFWGGAGGERNLVLPAAARTLILERSTQLPESLELG